MGRIAIRSGPKISSRHGRSIELVLRSTNCATSAGWIGSEWIEAGTEGEALRQPLVLIERQRLRTCQSLRRSKSRSLLPASHSPSLSCSFGTWGILARFDRRKCPYIKHEACQSGIPQTSVLAKQEWLKNKGKRQPFAGIWDISAPKWFRDPNKNAGI
jgi:hypothetical protein